MSCVSSVSYSVLLNGKSHGFIRPERGIRQGDPLSPFLFIMCAEALVHSLHRAEASGKLTGILLSTDGPLCVISSLLTIVLCYVKHLLRKALRSN